MQTYYFGSFALDPADRRLTRDGVPVELSGRYLDALALLVADAGKLVSKDRFMDEVWRGVPVTDEALTQCVRSLRRVLGDDAARPRFIETVPKHGYRFIAPLDGAVPTTPIAVTPHPLQSALLLGAGGTIGGGLAGLLGGLFYGFGGASQPLGPDPLLSQGVGATSILLVLVCVTILLGLVGAAGVSFGIAAARLTRRDSLAATLLGAGLGGLLVGGIVKLLGLDAFNLFLGRSPSSITGALEGLILGLAVGLGTWLAARRPTPLARAILRALLIGAFAGLVIILAGGHLLGGSLDQLARGFPESRLSLAPLGALTGETGFGPRTALVTAILEAATFVAVTVAALTLARRHLGELTF